jgi:hypothetical protein
MDDSIIIPRNSSVLVRRVPLINFRKFTPRAARPFYQNNFNYLNNQNPNLRNPNQSLSVISNPENQLKTNESVADSNLTEEDSQIAAMLTASAANWSNNPASSSFNQRPNFMNNNQQNNHNKFAQQQQ